MNSVVRATAQGVSRGGFMVHAFALYFDKRDILLILLSCRKLKMRVAKAYALTASRRGEPCPD